MVTTAIIISCLLALAVIIAFAIYILTFVIRSQWKLIRELQDRIMATDFTEFRRIHPVTPKPEKKIEDEDGRKRPKVDPVLGGRF